MEEFGVLSAGKIKFEPPKTEFVDEVQLAKDSPWDMTISRYKNSIARPDQDFYAALIEEIIRLRNRVEALENKHE